MSTDYSKKKNAELAEILKSRALPHTGKKDELIARIQESDAKAASTATKEAAKPTTTPVEDEIDWDDDTPITTDPPTTSEPAAAALAAGGLGRVASPTAVPNQIPAIDPSKASESTAEAAPTTTETATKTATEVSKPSNENLTEEKPAESKPPPANFTSGVPTTTLDDELLKRQKRAQRFGTTDPASSEALKALERAKKFGTTASDSSAALVKGLDEPLPERTKGTKRGRGDKDEGENTRAGSKPRRQGGGGRRDQGGRNGGRRGAGGRKRDGKSGSPAPGKANGLSEKDRVKAEARKSRFAAAA